MALTPEFEDAVNSRNLLRVRIMLKDSLLVDKSFGLFKEMRRYAENRGLDIWMEKTEEIEIANRSEWNVDLLNLELTRLVSDFTKERFTYCKSIIEKVYGVPAYSSQIRGKQKPVTGQQPTAVSPKRFTSGNSADYSAIIRNAANINRILRNNKSPQGDRTWPYSDIEAIQAAAKKINAACENIKSRRR